MVKTRGSSIQSKLRKLCYRWKQVKRKRVGVPGIVGVPKFRKFSYRLKIVKIHHGQKQNKVVMRSSASGEAFSAERSKDEASSPMRGTVSTNTDRMASFPRIATLDRDRAVQRSVQLEFVATRLNDVIFTTARPVEIRFSLADLEWLVTIGKEADDKKLSIKRTLLTKIHSAEWGICARTSVELSGIEDSATLKTGRITSACQKYQRSAVGWTWSLGSARTMPFIKIPEIGQESVRSVVDVDLEFTTTNMFGLRCRSLFSYDFTEPNKDSDLIFKFGGGDVFINCTYLSFHSEYFCATKDRLSGMDCDENGFPFQEMDGDKKEFMQLMLMVYPSEWKVTGENVKFILRLADRFMFDGVLRKCEKFLKSDDSKTDIFMKLQWAFQYSMYDLLEWCLSHLKTRANIQKVLKSDLYSKLSVDVVRSLLEKSLESPS